jgi:hypothetical protein
MSVSIAKRAVTESAIARQTFAVDYNPSVKFIGKIFHIVISPA